MGYAISRTVQLGKQYNNLDKETITTTTTTKPTTKTTKTTTTKTTNDDANNPVTGPTSTTVTG